MLTAKLSSPLVTNKYTLYPGDLRVSTLSLALLIKDAYTDRVIRSGIQVILKANPKNRPIVNVSGYYCFSRLQTNSVIVLVEPTSGNFGVYSKHTQTIDLTALDAKNPVVKILLIPKSNYPFPKQATLIRGLIVNNNNEGINKALIEAIYVDEQDNNETEIDKLGVVQTDQFGDFAIALKQIKFQDNKMPPILDIKITITFATFEKTVLIAGSTINEGSTLNFGNIQFP